MPRFEIRAPTDDEENAAQACLKRHTIEMGGVVTRDEPFSVLARAESKIVGGLIGKIFWNWLYADLVWVEPPFRGSGIGKEIMQKAEQEARNCGLIGVYLWTETWQAPDFYRRLGYKQFVEFENFPPGHKRFGFRKYLQDPEQ